MGAKSYRDLEIYQLSYDLAMKIHHMSLKLPKYELYEEGGQIRKSSKGVPSTIVEGYGKRKYKITGKGDPDGAELAIKNGAWDYVQKPFSVQQALLALKRVLEFREQKKSQKPAVAIRREGIIGDSFQIRDCLDLMAQAANTDTSVLITGETGTGKELFARAIHNNSLRAEEAFVVVDCATLPQTLVESTLFGHEKGSFTGADKRQEGLVKQADGGTLFLDEVGELPLTVQRAFLRVLQEYRFRPVGSSQEVHSDFRLIAATNRNLDQSIQAAEFPPGPFISPPVHQHRFAPLKSASRRYQGSCHILYNQNL